MTSLKSWNYLNIGNRLQAETGRDFVSLLPYVNSFIGRPVRDTVFSDIKEVINTFNTHRDNGDALDNLNVHEFSMVLDLVYSGFPGDWFDIGCLASLEDLHTVVFSEKSADDFREAYTSLEYSCDFDELVEIVEKDLSIEHINELLSLCAVDVPKAIVLSELMSEEVDYSDDWDNGTGYLMVAEDHLASYVEDYLENHDDYFLGCFNSWFLSDYLKAPAHIIALLQEREAYEAIGEWLRESADFGEMAEELLNEAGNLLSGYDGEEVQIGDYYFYRND